MGALSGRHAVVTGGGRGIGRAIAVALTDAGAHVSIIGRNEADLAAVVAGGGAHAHAAADVRDGAKLAAALEMLGRDRPVDIAVANAGGAETGAFATVDPAQFQRMFDLNVMGTVHLTQAVLPSMLRRGAGRIVAIASTAALRGYPYVAAYCAAKHAVLGLVRALAQETASRGVTVNAICPGYTDTDLVAGSLERIAEKTGRSREEALGLMLADNPQKRLVRPAEVAASVLHLCLDASAAINGQAIALNGGEF